MVVAGAPGAREHSEQMALRAGELIANRFLIERLAGLGGMGAVYRAHDLQTKGFAAVKVMSRQHPSTRDRFMREASLLAALSHPAVVTYLAHGSTQAKIPFIAMEWLDGEDLAVRLSRQQLEVDEALLLIERTCHGLAAAHAKGITHRDVKPSNLFLVDGDVAKTKVLDFGVARREAITRPLTHAGAMIGTVGYMSPEQATGSGEVDARADVFALGCVLYECLTGRAAFTGQHDIAVLAKVLRDDPPRASTLRPELGTSYDNLLTRMLAKDRVSRPPDAVAVLEALAQLQQTRKGDRDRVAVVRPALETGAGLLGTSEQRIVSVILGATSSSMTVDDDQGQRAWRQLGALALRYHAELMSLQGGAVLLVLGTTSNINASDQAAQAARCALELVQLQPALSVAVSTGAVDRTSDIPVGAAIDRAADLLRGAGTTSAAVRVDELTVGLLGSRFDVQRSHGTFGLLAERDVLEAPRVFMGKPTPVVGRDKELAFLDATLDECVGDEVMRAVLIEAPAGMGKSRLGREFLDRVRAKGTAHVLAARAGPMSAGSAMHLLQGLVRSAAALRGTDSPALQRQRLRDHLRGYAADEPLERLLDFLGELIGVPAEREPCALLRAARNDPEIMREQSRRAMEAWLEAESARRPLVLFLEDAHWGDLPSVTYLEQMLRKLEGRPIMAVVLARPELHEKFPHFWRTLELHVMPLRALTRRAADRLVRATLPASTPENVTTRILDLAEGNAFYLEELIRRAAEGSTDFPETVLTIMQSRLDELPPAARRVLRAASVFGERCWQSGVETLLGREHTETRACFDVLVAREMLAVAHAGSAEEPEYVFRHALLRDAVYASLGPADLLMAHGLAAQWLELRGERDPNLLADHHARSRTPERAIPWLARAAIASVEQGDFGGGIELSRRGLALGAAGSDRAVLILVGASASTWGRHADISLLPEALALLPHGKAHWWLALSVLVFGSIATGDSEGAARYLTLAYDTDPEPGLIGFYGQALQTLASSAILTGRTDVGWSVVARFDDLRTADNQSDPTFASWRDLARCHLATYSPLDGSWQLERALGWARAGASAMQAAGSASGETIARFFLATVMLFLGAYEEAEAALRTCIEQSTRAGNVLNQLYARLLLAWVMVRRDRLDEAGLELRMLGDARDLTVVHGVHAIGAEIDFRRGLLQEALTRADQAMRGPAAPYRRMAGATLARTELALGRYDRALLVVEQALTDGNVAPNIEFEVDLMVSRAKALTHTGASVEAERWIAQARSFIESVAAGLSDADLRGTFVNAPEAHRELRRLERG